MNARLTFRDDKERDRFIQELDLDRNEILLEGTDRYAVDHALLVHPTCPDALVVGRHLPELRQQGDRGVTKLRTLYLARQAEAVKILMSHSGSVDISPSRLFVLRRAA
jgi:hypothetical protein